MSKYMTPKQAQHVLHGNITPPESGSTTYYAQSFRALETLATDTLEYGVADANGDIEWFTVDANTGTAEDARQDAINYAASDQFFRLVCRRVSEPWEVTDDR